MSATEAPMSVNAILRELLGSGGVYGSFGICSKAPTFYVESLGSPSAMKRFAAIVCAPLLFGCATSHVVGMTAEGAKIDEITLKQANVYVIECAQPILIDTGTV